MEERLETVGRALGDCWKSAWILFVERLETVGRTLGDCLKSSLETVGRALGDCWKSAWRLLEEHWILLEERLETVGRALGDCWKRFEKNAHDLKLIDGHDERGIAPQELSHGELDEGMLVDAKAV